MRSFRTRALLVGIGCAGLLGARPARSGLETDPRSASALVGSTSISADGVRRHVDYLARPEWRGRAPGSEGADSCASYIEGRFREAGLRAISADGGMRISTPMASGVRIQGVVGLRDERHGYTFGRDYWPQGFSSDGEVLSTLVFAGYGITAEESGYDDYAGVDVQGRVVVVLSGAPGTSQGVSKLFPDCPSWASTPFAKARRARSLGASAILFLTAPAGDGPRERLWAVPQERAFADAGIVACHVSGAAGESLLSAARLRPGDLQAKIDQGLRPQSREMPGDSVEVRVSARRLPGAAVNVVAVQPGRSQETVVVAACYDGYGATPPPALLTCPGAIDNGSGTAALLEIARAMRDAPAVARTICFVAYAGRDLEGGGFDTVLDGSGLDRGRIAAVIDLGALGHARENRLYAVGDRGTLETTVRGLNALLAEEWEVRWRSPAPEGTLPQKLARAGIPAVGFSTGNAREFGTPEDVPDLLDPAAVVRAGRLAYGLIRAVAEEAR